MHAVARLVLHPLITNIQTSWVKMGPDGARRLPARRRQRLGGTLMNESITRAAGAAHGQEMTPAEMEALIRAAGRVPRQRTTLYADAPAAQRAASFAAAPDACAPLPLPPPPDEACNGRIRHGMELAEYEAATKPQCVVRGANSSESQIVKLRAYVAAACLMLLAPAHVMAAESYPTKPVRFIVGLSAGSSTDVTARVIANKLGQILGQQFIVENRPGASSNLAAGYVAGSPKDGYTLLFGSVANTINATLLPSTNFDLVRDFAPVTLVGTVPNILLVNPSLGVKTLDEFIALAKSKPDEIMFASSGIGTSSHLSAEMFNIEAGVKLVHVPYQGSSQAMADLIAGRTSVIFTPAQTAVQLMKAGQVTAIASTQLKRSGIAPDLPTLDELGLKGFDTGTWYGIYAPAGTPEPVIATLSKGVNEALKSPEVLSAFEPQGIDALGGTPQEFAAYVHSEIEKWRKVVDTAGLKHRN